jgi:15-cis-phytoene synthase
MNHAITALVRRNDPDRFLTALFAPAEKRDALLTLYAFNHDWRGRVRRCRSRRSR